MTDSEQHFTDGLSYGARLLIFCSIAFVCYLASYMRIPIVPLYAQSLGAGEAQVGLINSSFFLMAGLLSLPLGMLSDRLGRKRLACTGLLVLAATSFCLYFSRTPGLLMLVYLFFGVGLAAFGPTMMSLVADFSPSTHLGRSYGWYTTALYCGMSFGPAAGGFMAHQWGFLRVFLVSGALILLNFGFASFLLPGGESVKYASPRRGLSGLGALFRNRPLLGCWLTTLGGCFGLGMFITFIPLHARSQGLDVREVGLVFFAQGLCNAVSRIPLGHLSDRVADRRTLVVWGILGFAASMAGFGVSSRMLHFTAFALTLGASMGLAFTSIGALIAEAVPADARGLAMGGYNTCIYFGIMLSSACMGVVIQKIGFQAGFLITAGLNLILIGAFRLLMREWLCTESDTGTRRAESRLR
jgi:MFS family permease